MQTQIKDQHAQLRKLLDRFESNTHEPLSSGTAHELMDKLFHLMVQHIKTECDLLKLICDSVDPLHSHNQHSTDILTELTDFNFELLSRSNKPLASIMPQIRKMIDVHENFHVHAVLLK